MNDLTTYERAGLAKTANPGNKKIVDFGFFSVGDVLDGEEIRGLSEPFSVVETADMRAEGGESDEKISVKKQYAYFA